MFSDYLQLGMDHILDYNGYDHILFVAVLCSLYSPIHWKKIIILVTAFTLGHSLTLALAALDIVNIQASLVERLIPVTIILTAGFNIFTVTNDHTNDKNVMLNYALSTGFGLIHGLGFSNYFKAILGKEESIVRPLFAFNIGVEAGQIIVVALVMTLGYLLMNILKLPKKYWTIPISLAAILIASYLLSQR